MSLWGRIFAVMYDPMMGRTEEAGLRDHRRALERRIRERAPQTQLLRAPAEDLPFNDDSFDTVVTTLVLCTVDDQPRTFS